VQDIDESKTRHEDLADTDPDEWESPSSIDWEQLRSSLELLASQRGFLLRCVLAGAILSALIAFSLPASYQATVVLMPPDSSSSFSPLSLMMGMGMGQGADIKGGAESGAALGAVGELLGAKSPGQLYLRVLSTHVVEDRLINRFNLMSVYKAKLRVNSRKRLESLTSAAEDKKSGVITIGVEDHDPKRAAALANAYAEELNSLLVEISSGAAGRERAYLEQHLDQAKRDMDESAVALSQFSSKNATINLDEQGKAMVDAGAQLQGQMIAAEADLRGMQQLYTDNNPRVQQLKARITELQQQIQKLGGTEKSLQQQGTPSDEMYPPIRKLPLIGVFYMDLYRRAKINEAVYTALIEHYELEKLEEGRNVAKVQVLDPADVPEKKSSPHRMIIILGGIFLFLAAGLGWVFAQHWWNKMNSDDPRRRLVEPCLNRLARFPGFRAKKVTTV